MGVVGEISKTTNAQIELARRAQEKARYLAAMPIDKTSAAMQQWEGELLKAARAIATTPEQIKEAMDKLREAAEHGTGAWENQANQQAQLAGMAKESAKRLQVLALTHDATVEDTKYLNGSMRAEADRLVAFGQLAPEHAQSFIELTQAQIEARGSLKTVFSEIESAAKEAGQVELALKEIKMPAQLLGKSMMQAHLEMAGAAKAVAEKREFTPEQAKELYEKAISKVDMTKSKLTMDFRNSRFDITQNYAEGFDPDRIAVAFTQDLAALGERRLQSGLAPIYGAR
jgi:hypothetical protein